MKFKVVATKQVLTNPPRNPFRISIENFSRGRVIDREWEFDAKDEAEVRKYWTDAKKQCLENVNDFELQSITPSP